MKYKGPDGFGRIMNIIMNLFMSAAFSFVMLWLAQQRAGDMAQVLTPVNYLFSFITGFGIGYVVADLIPVFNIGKSAAEKLGLKGLPGYIVTILVLDLLLTTIISFLMTMINMTERAGAMGAFMSWLGSYPMMLIIGYVVQFIIMKPAMAFAKRTSGFDPENPMPPMGMMPPAGRGATGPSMPPASNPDKAFGAPPSEDEESAR